MSMYEEIKSSVKQLSFEPKIENEENLKKTTKYLIVGMGGSHLAGDLLKMIKPELDIIIHSSYGLPPLSAESLKDRLIILSSYSGNTEEPLDAYEEAGKLGLDRAILAVGGKLLAKAKEDNIPYIQMPDFNLQPRSALVLSLKSFLKIIGEEKSLEELTKLKDIFVSENFELKGKELAQELKNSIPIIYTSEKNRALGYIWKIKFNETGKIPAFYNVLPELNHNEMTSFDVQNTTQQLSEKFYFIFLTDKNDHPKIQKRMKITAKLYEDRKLKTCKVEITSENIFAKIFSTLTIADFAAYFTAENYGLESEQVPMVEEFKKLIA